MKRYIRQVLFWTSFAGLTLLLSAEGIVYAIRQIRRAAETHQETLLVHPTMHSQIQLTEVIAIIGAVLFLTSGVLAVVVMVMERWGKRREEVIK